MSALLEDLAPHVLLEIAAWDQAFSAAKCLLGFLGKQQLFKVMNGAGAYAGEPFAATLEDLTRHFAGEVTLGVCCLKADGRSRFLGFDIDALAEVRIPIAARVLAARGYGGAMIATNGSAPGRGKLLLFFKYSKAGPTLNRLAQSVLEECRQDPEWQKAQETAQTVEIRPQGSSGGVLRIGGRHAKKNGPLERFFDPLTGELLFLSSIGPSTVDLKDEPEAVSYSPEQPWVQKILAEGIDYGPSGERGVFELVLRFGNEAHRGRSAVEGKAVFLGWMKTLAENSPGLEKPSPKNKDKRHPLRRKKLERIWSMVLANLSQGVTIHYGGGGNVSSHPIEQTLRDFVEKRGLNPVAFALSYEEIGKALGCHKQVARRAILKAEAEGVLVRVDPGIRRGIKGVPPRKTLYSLEPARALEHHAVKHRRLEREAYEGKKVVPIAVPAPTPADLAEAAFIAAAEAQGFIAPPEGFTAPRSPAEVLQESLARVSPRAARAFEANRAHNPKLSREKLRDIERGFVPWR